MKTTFSRTVTAIAIVLLIALLLIGITFQLLVKDFLVSKTTDDLADDAEMIAQLVQAYHAEAGLRGKDFHVALTAAASVSGADVVLCDAYGRLLMCANEPYGCEHVGMLLSPDYRNRVFANNGTRDTGVIEGLYADRRYILSKPLYSANGAPIGILLVSSPVVATTNILSRLTRFFVVVSVLITGLSVVLMVVFVRKQSTPLRKMAQAAKAFGHGELTARVNPNPHSTQEVNELALAFNNMASSLEKSEYQRQEFVANISHELKTPMTTISGYVDGILDGTLPPETHEKYLRLVSGETKRLSRLVRSMLDLSRLKEQGAVPPEQKRRFDVTECAGQTLISFENAIVEKALQVQVELPEHPVYTAACQDYITQVFYNLLDNAIKFAPRNGQLRLEIKEDGHKVYVSISNTGTPIPPQELPLVFDRFHKLDKSRSENRDGWGLGLSIVKTILELHGENISVTSQNDLTTFTFTLPLVL